MEFVRVSLTLVYVLFCGVVAARTPQKRWAVDDYGCRTPDKGVGYCTRISECQTMLDFLKTNKTFTEREQSALRSYHCGVYGVEPKVCCPSEPIDLGWTVEEDRCVTPDGDEGICTSIKTCKIIYNFIEANAVTDELKQTLNKYICGSGASGYKICCPSKLPATLLMNRNGDDTQHPNAKLLPKECGQSGTSEKITNGNETSLFEYPWAAVLKYEKKTNQWSCGASLISNRYVLTAAHCIRSKNKLTTVRLGEHNFNTDPDCEELQEKICADPPQDFEVTKDDAIVHPGYDSNTLKDDIALIRLPREANTAGYSVFPICLPITAAEKTRVFNNYTVIGWGATETGFSSPILLKVIVPRVEIPECAPNYASRTRLTDKQLCAGGKKEQDSCAGDSGGPLMAEYTFDGTFKTIQYGIVSLGPRICGREGFPAVYTRVDKYMGWILDNIKP